MAVESEDVEAIMSGASLSCSQLKAMCTKYDVQGVKRTTKASMVNGLKAFFQSAAAPSCGTGTPQPDTENSTAQEAQERAPAAQSSTGRALKQRTGLSKKAALEPSKKRERAEKPKGSQKVTQVVARSLKAAADSLAAIEASGGQELTTAEKDTLQLFQQAFGHLEDLPPSSDGTNATLMQQYLKANSLVLQRVTAAGKSAAAFAMAYYAMSINVAFQVPISCLPTASDEPVSLALNSRATRAALLADDKISMMSAHFVRWVEKISAVIPLSASLRPFLAEERAAFVGNDFLLGPSCRPVLMAAITSNVVQRLAGHLATFSEGDEDEDSKWTAMTAAYLKKALQVLDMAHPSTVKVFAGTELVQVYMGLYSQCAKVQTEVRQRFDVVGGNPEAVTLAGSVTSLLEDLFVYSCGLLEHIIDAAESGGEVTPKARLPDKSQLLSHCSEIYKTLAKLNFQRTCVLEEGTMEYLDRSSSRLLALADPQLLRQAAPYTASVYYNVCRLLVKEGERRAAVQVLAKAINLLQSAAAMVDEPEKLQEQASRYHGILHSSIVKPVVAKYKQLCTALKKALRKGGDGDIGAPIRAYVELKHQYPLAVLMPDDEDVAAAAGLPLTLIAVAEGTSASLSLRARVLEHQLLYEQEELRYRFDELSAAGVQTGSGVEEAAMESGLPTSTREELNLLLTVFLATENEVLEYLLACAFQGPSLRRAHTLVLKAISLRSDSAYRPRSAVEDNFAQLVAYSADLSKLLAKPTRPKAGSVEAQVEAALNSALRCVTSPGKGDSARRLPLGILSAAHLQAEIHSWKAVVLWEIYGFARALPYVCSAYQACVAARKEAADMATVSSAGLMRTERRVADMLHIFGELSKYSSFSSSLLASLKSSSSSDESQEAGAADEVLAQEEQWYQLQHEFMSAADHTVTLEEVETQLDLLTESVLHVAESANQLRRSGRIPSVMQMSERSLQLLYRHRAHLARPGTVLDRPQFIWRNFAAAVDVYERLGYLHEQQGEDKEAEGFYRLGYCTSELVKAPHRSCRFLMLLGDLHYRRGLLDKSADMYSKVLAFHKDITGKGKQQQSQYPALALWSAHEWDTAFAAPSTARLADIELRQGNESTALGLYTEVIAILDGEDDTDSLAAALADLDLSPSAPAHPGLREAEALLRSKVAVKQSLCGSVKEQAACFAQLAATLKSLDGLGAGSDVLVAKARVMNRMAGIQLALLGNKNDAAAKKAVGGIYLLLTSGYQLALKRSPPGLVKQLAYGIISLHQRAQPSSLVPSNRAWECAALHASCLQLTAIHTMRQVGARNEEGRLADNWADALEVLCGPEASSHTARVAAFQEHVKQLPETHTVCCIGVTPSDDRLVITRLQRGRPPIVAVIPLAKTATQWLASFKEVVGETDALWQAFSKGGGKDAYLNGRLKLDKKVEAFVKTWQQEWLGIWPALLSGVPKDEEHAEAVRTQATQLARTYGVEEHLAEMYVLSYAFPEHRGAVGKAVFGDGMPPILDNGLFGRQAEVEPVQMLLDSRLQRLPWEAMPCLYSVAACRVPFAHMQLVTEALHPVQESSVTVDRQKTFYVVNPKNEDNLSATVARLAPALQTQAWRGMVGTEPSKEQMLSVLADYDVYLYCGHGSSERYVDRSAVSQHVDRAPVAMLMGCSSCLLRQEGQYEADGFALRLLLTGSPAVVGFLWDVTDKDCDRICATLTQWLGMLPEDYVHKDINLKQLTEGVRGGKLADMVPLARKSTTLRYLNGAALVYYGVPDVRLACK